MITVSQPMGPRVIVDRLRVTARTCEHPRPVQKPTITTLRSFAAGVVLLMLALIPSTDLRFTGLYVVAAIGVWFAPAIVRLPLALVAGHGMVGGWGMTPFPIFCALASAILALLCWPRDRESVLRAVLVLFALGVVQIGAHPPDGGHLGAAWGALPLLVVLVTPLERLLPRRLLVLALLAASLPGAIGLERALVAKHHAEQTKTRDAWIEAAIACARVEWHACGEMTAVKFCESDPATHDQCAAMEPWGDLEYPAPTTVLLRSDFALATPDGAAHARLALAELAEESPDAQRQLSPLGARTWAHALARANHRREAQAVDPSLSPAVAVPEGWLNFADAIALSFAPSPPACVKRGDIPPVAFTWLVEDGFAPGEEFLCFVHADGPGLLGFDHFIGGRRTSSMKRGERIVDPLTTPVPLDAPAGRYVMHVGVYAPDSQVRLQPRGQPTHIAFVEGPSFEVCP
jgi:hypothetical protein